MNRYVFTLEEVDLLIALVARLDADKFVHNSAKALIYKSKSFMDDTAKKSTSLTIRK